MTITYHRFSSWANRKGGNTMGNYNDFDLDLKMVQENGDAGAASTITPMTIYYIYYSALHRRVFLL